MTSLSRTNFPNTHLHPIRIVQFGTGNFLRAFADYAFYILNKTCHTELGVVALQSTESGQANLISEQEGLFTLLTQGMVGGALVKSTDLIDVLVHAQVIREDYTAFLALAREPDLKFVVSNTTEAGISFKASDSPELTPPESYPAKLTLFLYERFKHFKGSLESGLIVLPCELITQNADNLKALILRYIEDWKLEADFKAWVLHANAFYNTLVDRIVSGYPDTNTVKIKQNLGYEDALMVTSEPFFLWAIEANETLKELLPFHLTPLNVKIVPDLQPYHTRKIRILNGAHTAMVPLGLMQGIQTVGACMEDTFTANFIQDLLLKEVIPTLNQDTEDLESYAFQVLDRFKNPFISHNLASIALNSIAKFKVRLLPTLLTYYQTLQQYPPRITFAFAALLLFTKGDWEGNRLPVNEDTEVKDRIRDIWQKYPSQAAITELLATTEYWGKDLSQEPGLVSMLSLGVSLIDKYGIENGWKQFNTSIKTI